jgi:ubiquinone/menaquinone biosynthesis C-methylase UbiE
MIRIILTWTAAGFAMVVLIMQVRKPHKWLGRPFLWIMNRSHSNLTDWGLRQISINEDFKILDVGCGGGRTIQKLASISNGMVCGVDYASGSVAVSRSKNAELIKRGLVEVHEASVSQLPFADSSFDLATAVETQYYWPDLVNDMKEVRRVLKPGGRLVVIAETYKGGRMDPLKAPVMKLLKSSHLSVDEQRELFLAAGYEDVQIFEEKKHGWICATGRRPAATLS